MKMFRNIRRKLLLLGKIKNYLVYALGEILLIVFGILIAWKINDINELHKNKIVQVKIYESLYDELNTNLNVLDSAITRYNRNVLSLQNILNYVGLEQNELTQEAKDQIVQVKFRNTILRNEALSSINNTDKFQFLEKESSTQLLAQYPSEIKTFSDQEIKLRNIIESRLKPIIEKHISLIDMLSEEIIIYNQIKTYGQKSNYIALLNSSEYQNSVIDLLLQTKIQVNNSEDLRRKTEILGFQLLQELNG